MSKKYVTISGDSVFNINGDQLLIENTNNYIESENESDLTVIKVGDDKVLYAGDIRQTDQFLISQPYLTNVDPDRVYEFNGKVYEPEYASRNVTYECLSDCMFNSLCAKLGLKSMAWELSDHYSLIDHIHEYSTVSCRPEYPTAVSRKYTPLAVFSVNTKKISFNVPITYTYKSPEPYIGELKFLALPVIPEIPNTEEYYASNEFSGWVYPDGRAVSRERFSRAFAQFGTIYGAGDGTTTFNIPNINGMYCPVSPKSCENDKQLNEVQPEVKVLPKHRHGISDMSLNGTVDGVFKVTHVNNWDWPTTDKVGIHGYPDSKSSFNYNVDIYFKCNNLACTTSDIKSAVDQTKTYPSRVNIPALMYIGTE